MNSYVEANDFEIPLAEVAKKLRKTELDILMYIRCGFIEAEECDDNWLLSKSSLGRFLGESSQVTCATGRRCSECPGCR